MSELLDSSCDWSWEWLGLTKDEAVAKGSAENWFLHFSETKDLKPNRFAKNQSVHNQDKCIGVGANQADSERFVINNDYVHKVIRAKKAEREVFLVLGCYQLPSDERLRT